MSIYKYLLISIILISVKTHAFGYNFCPNPGVAPPEFFNISKPAQPKCINLKNNSHNCDNITFDLYKKKVKKYNFEKDIYVKNLNTYLDNVLEFINCEIEHL